VKNLGKSTENGKDLGNREFSTFHSVVLSNVILAVGTIVLMRPLSPEENGLCSVVLLPSMMMNL
jgi:hypothetical protein